MKNNNYFTAATGLIFFVLLFVFSENFIVGINSGLMNCVRIVIPSVFPFLIASSLTGYGGLPEPLKKFFEPVTRFLFGLPADTLPAIILGQLGGYLAGAKSAESLRKNGIISSSQAERITLFGVNAGMGFSINAVGNAMLCSREAGRILFVSLCVSSLFSGFLLRFFSFSNPNTENRELQKYTSFSSAVTLSVTSATKTTLASCGFIVLFSGLCAVTESLVANESIKAALSCLFEVTRGCIDLAGKTSLPVIAFVCAFGGLCVHLQVFSVSKVNAVRFYLFRLINAVSAYLICKIILYFNPVESPVFLSLSKNAEPFSFSVPAAISLVFLSFLLILDLDYNRKIC